VGAAVGASVGVGVAAGAQAAAIKAMATIAASTENIFFMVLLLTLLE
jgi:hypothetical protein